jgi:hypothetical protein
MVEEGFLERLAQSKAAADEEAASVGANDGEEWATDDATFDQLRRLAAMEREGVLDAATANSVAEMLAGFGLSASDTAEVWEEMSGDRYPSAAYVRSFVEGALDASRSVAFMLA